MSIPDPREDRTKAALDYHEFPTPGKVSIAPTKQLTNQSDLALAYSPGVAAACNAIVEDPLNVFRFTARGNKQVREAGSRAYSDINYIDVSTMIPAEMPSKLFALARRWLEREDPPCAPDAARSQERIKTVMCPYVKHSHPRFEEPREKIALCLLKRTFQNGFANYVVPSEPPSTERQFYRNRKIRERALAMEAQGNSYFLPCLFHELKQRSSPVSYMVVALAQIIQYQGCDLALRLS